MQRCNQALKLATKPLNLSALDRSVETLGVWIVTSSVTFIKSANQCSIKLCLFFALLTILSADAHWILLKLEIYSFHSSHAPITVLRLLIHSNYQVTIHPLCGSCISFIKGAKVPGRNFTYINAEICSAKQNDIQSQNFCALESTTTICTVFHVKAFKSI